MRDQSEAKLSLGVQSIGTLTPTLHSLVMSAENFAIISDESFSSKFCYKRSKNNLDQGAIRHIESVWMIGNPDREITRKMQQKIEDHNPSQSAVIEKILGQKV